MEEEQSYIQLWNEAATEYRLRRDSDAGELAAIYEPVVAELLGEVSRKRVLDAGCGGGDDARRLASLGALVTGIDGSAEMIAIAKKQKPKIGLDFRVADLTKGLPFADNHFDIVLANMVLMDLPRIDVAIAEFARILRTHGALVYSITHPCFFLSDWALDENGQKQHKQIFDYLTPCSEELNFWGKTMHFHRPLFHYFEALAQNGFCVDAFHEPVPSDEAVEEHRDWEYHGRVPSFVVARAILKGKRSEERRWTFARSSSRN